LSEEEVEAELLVTVHTLKTLLLVQSEEEVEDQVR
jgi:hypothetical protein